MRFTVSDLGVGVLQSTAVFRACSFRRSLGVTPKLESQGTVEASHEACPRSQTMPDSHFTGSMFNPRSYLEEWPAYL